MSGAYYNEIDPEKAAWIRELIKAGVVAEGDVDERSIHDVRPADLRGYTQCHFFAGIGVWSYALGVAGWPDDRPVWTGSCPCPSFSEAGQGQGFDDARHLWPVWWPLLRECRPAVVFGEQSAAAIGYGWWDLVSTDLESAAYAAAAAVLASASVGAADIRHRLYFVGERVGNTGSTRLEGHAGHGDIRNEPGRHGAEPVGSVAATGASGGLADAASSGHNGRWPGEPGHEGEAGERGGAEFQPERFCAAGGLADADGGQSGHGPIQSGWQHGLVAQDGGTVRHPFAHALNGFWRDADWLLCTDGRWRPVRPGSFPLVAGAPARLVRLRGYGDAINAQVAAAFVRAYMDSRKDTQ